MPSSAPAVVAVRRVDKSARAPASTSARRLRTAGGELEDDAQVGQLEARGEQHHDVRVAKRRRVVELGEVRVEVLVGERRGELHLDGDRVSRVAEGRFVHLTQRGGGDGLGGNLGEDL